MRQAIYNTWPGQPDDVPPWVLDLAAELRPMVEAEARANRVEWRDENPTALQAWETCAEDFLPGALEGVIEYAAEWLVDELRDVYVAAYTEPPVEPESNPVVYVRRVATCDTCGRLDYAEDADGHLLFCDVPCEGTMGRAATATAATVAEINAQTAEERERCEYRIELAPELAEGAA